METSPPAPSEEPTSCNNPASGGLSGSSASGEATEGNKGKEGAPLVGLSRNSFGLEDVKRTFQSRGKGRGPMVSPVESDTSLQIGQTIQSVLTNQSLSTATKTETERRESQRTAQRLLKLCQCAHCLGPIREPVTLPCGHSSCLDCIMKATTGASSSSASMPCSSHLPPRLPLSATTVPCPVAGCPRSAIGRGMGLWSGHCARYGPNATAELCSTMQTNGPGSAPLDGFVAPQNQECNRLVVIPAQRRNSFSEKFAISNYSLQSSLMSEETGLLRPDVTMAKAVELLREFAQTSATTSDSSQPSPSRRLLSQLYARDDANSRHRRLRRPRAPLRRSHRQTPSRSTSPAPFAHHPAGTRTEINPLFMSVLGVSERGRDSGAEGGVRANWDTDEEDGEDDGDAMEAAMRDSGLLRRWTDQEGGEESARDDQDEEIGGAFARQYSTAAATETADTREEKGLAGVQSKLAGRDRLTPQDLHSELCDVLECQLCYMLLYQPLTTPCGHTFCRQCFARSLDHSSACPLCRADMPSFAFFQEHPPNLILMNLLTAEWKRADAGLDLLGPGPIEEAPSTLGLKQLYLDRQTAVEKEAQESLLSTPLFVCTLAFPHMPTILHIFEPRYRLMIRRCLESGHARFGMVLHSQDVSGPVPGMSRYGTMLEIKTVQILPDGRSMIETVGSHRFRVLERGSLDGYTVGQIERIDDVEDEEAEDQLERASVGSVDPDASPSVLAEAREAQATLQAAIGVDLSRGEVRDQSNPVTAAFTQSTMDELVDSCNAFVETLRSGSAPWLMTRLNHTYGPMPDSSNVAAFGYWMALVMPIDEHEKAKLLPIRSPRLRLRIVVYWIEQLRQTWWFNHGCSIS